MKNVHLTIMKMRDMLLEKTSHASTIRLSLIAVNSWVVLNTLILLPAHSHFWGKGAYILPLDVQKLSFLEKITSLLSYPQYTELYPLLIGLQLIGALLAIFGRWPVFSQFLVLWTTLSLDQRASMILDGGNNLMHLFLIYLALMSFSPAVSGGNSFFHLRNGTANLAFLLARMQLVLVYLTAGLSKVHGELWPKGVALYYTMHVEEYGSPMLGALMSIPALTVLGSLATLAFQISFPFLVWNRKLRPFYLMAGTFFHLGISFGMGLMSFGFAMCTSYVVFYTDDKAEMLLNGLRRFRKGIGVLERTSR